MEQWHDNQMTPDEFHTIGTALYGPRWQSDLSRDMEVSDRSIRRWLNGQNPIPDGIVDRLADLISRRASVLVDMMALIKSIRSRPRLDKLTSTSTSSE